MKAIIRLAVCVFLCFQVLLAFGQPDFGSEDVNDVPLDGGLTLLLAAGVGYGAKKARDFRKQQLPKKK